MGDFLTAVRTVHKKSVPAESSEIEESEADKPNDLQRNISTAEEVLHALRSEPLTDTLLRLLKLLSVPEALSDDFSIHVSGALQARIINTLIETTLPAFWSVLNGKDKHIFAKCLMSLAGVSAVVAAVKRLSQPSDQRYASRIEDLLSVLQRLLDSDEAISRIWTNTLIKPRVHAKGQLAQRELVNLLASGKIVAVAAQAEDYLKATKASARSLWLSDGSKYAAWLGRNVATSGLEFDCRSDDNIKYSEAAALLLAKALSLGYAMPLTKSVIEVIMKSYNNAERKTECFEGILHYLPTFSIRQFLENTLRWFSAMLSDDPADMQLSTQQRETSAIAAFIAMLMRIDGHLALGLSRVFSNPALASSLSFTIRRASIAALAAEGETDSLETLLQKSVDIFGDQTFINHSPILQQEAVAQTLLMIAGYMHRKAPMALLLTARSSGHLRSVSERLDSPNHRARWLGMIVGMALSNLVDKEGSRMKFGLGETQTEEAKWYLELTKVNDVVGHLEDFEKFLRMQETIAQHRKKPNPKTKTEVLPIMNGKQTFGPPRPAELLQTEIIGDRVTEVVDDEDDEDDDLKPYAKPDSDPDDSDEDATLVNRTKTKAPVYIRDLMRMLHDDKDHDRFQMGIKHAPALIRRKANFGGEVKDHAEELAGMFCSMQDPFDTDNFDELRIQGLIAVLLSDVEILAPWLSRQAFSGDYSIAQRCVILSALGLGGRELAGFKNEDGLNPALPDSATGFPSKRLPGRLHATYSPAENSTKRLTAASKDVEQQMMKPLALSAADKSTSHLDAVKIRTFSSRLSTEQRTKRKLPPNQLAKIFGESFFFPLAGRYQQDIAAYSSGSLFASAPFLMVTFLKTLALLLHASGQATLALADITTTFWDLLLSLRVQAVQDISVMEAVLFSLLTLLEINGHSQERLAQENPKQIMQTKEWVEVVFERMGGGEMVTAGSDEEIKVRSLAAGVLVKIGEVAEGYQNMLMGMSGR